MKLNIIKLDGKYAVRMRRWWCPDVYADLIDPHCRYWWGVGDTYFKDCWTDDLEHARKCKRRHERVEGEVVVE